jgi:site-specific DNA recombinase
MRKPIRDTAPTKIRCAIYTRKSSEEGLEQDFNSLDAQREACTAYVISQRHEGWELIPEYYDDGGFSGGNTNRPALKLLLDEVAAGKVDVIVVYKVDRLTRSLADFAKIVEVLDDADASFVSVTQSFNTTTSMGRLTLNVLLSFAQFEREVTGERIRDKIAASKAKGMWMGGRVPLGYDLDDGTLVVNEHDAASVRGIFSRYLELGSGPQLVTELQRNGITSKARQCKDGRTYGGHAISRGGLYTILQNRAYVGEVAHKGNVYQGQQPAIVDRAVFDAVQNRLAGARVTRQRRVNANEPSPLAGLLVDGHGRRMSPSHAAKGSRRYRYYTSQRGGTDADIPTWRLSAPDIEGLVRTTCRDAIRDAVARRIETGDLSADETSRLERDRDTAIAQITDKTGHALTAQLRRHIMGISVRDTEIEVRLDLRDLNTALAASDVFVSTAAIQAVRTDGQVKLVIVPPRDPDARTPNRALVKLVSRAMSARSQLMENITDAAARYSRDYAITLTRLSYLAPDIVTAILNGQQPASLTREKLIRLGRLPVRWDEQRALLGFG